MMGGHYHAFSTDCRSALSQALNLDLKPKMAVLGVLFPIRQK